MASHALVKAKRQKIVEYLELNAERLLSVRPTRYAIIPELTQYVGCDVTYNDIRCAQSVSRITWIPVAVGRPAGKANSKSATRYSSHVRADINTVILTLHHLVTQLGCEHEMSKDFRRLASRTEQKHKHQRVEYTSEIEEQPIVPQDIVPALELMTEAVELMSEDQLLTSARHMISQLKRIHGTKLTALLEQQAETAPVPTTIATQLKEKILDKPKKRKPIIGSVVVCRDINGSPGVKEHKIVRLLGQGTRAILENGLEICVSKLIVVQPII